MKSEALANDSQTVFDTDIGLDMSDDLCFDQFLKGSKEMSPEESLLYSVVLLALGDLASENPLYRMSAVHFFRSDTFSFYLHHLMHDQNAIDFSINHMNEVCSEIEMDALIEIKTKCPDLLMCHEWFHFELCKQDAQFRAHNQKIIAKQRKIRSPNMQAQMSYLPELISESVFADAIREAAML